MFDPETRLVVRSLMELNDRRKEDSEKEKKKKKKKNYYTLQLLSNSAKSRLSNLANFFHRCISRCSSRLFAKTVIWANLRKLAHDPEGRRRSVFGWSVAAVQAAPLSKLKTSLDSANYRNIMSPVLRPALFPRDIDVWPRRNSTGHGCGATRLRGTRRFVDFRLLPIPRICRFLYRPTKRSLNCRSSFLFLTHCWPETCSIVVHNRRTCNVVKA